MKNLELYELNAINIRDTLKGATKTLVINDIIYAVIDKLVYKYCKINLTRTLLCEYECVTELCYVVLENIVFFGTGKEFVYHCLDTGQVDVVECPTEFAVLKWSPSQEILAVATVDGRVLTFSVDFIGKKLLCLGESNINDKISGSYNVGWGSKETQFRGSEGKKKVKNEEIPCREVTDICPRIIWRDDGELFLVNYFYEGKRAFKVYKAPCTLSYASEDLAGLQSAIAWKCKGNMIACPTWTDKMRITIFEKNGLSTHSFCLYDQVEVENLEWNNTGDVLAVHQKTNNQSYLSLYTMSNYKWMLKQRLLFNENNPLITFQWSEYMNNLFQLIVSTITEVVFYKFVYKVHLSPLKVNNKGTNIVVNGNAIMLNNFANCVIPPPYAEIENVLKQPVSHVVFCPDNFKVLLIDCANHCYVLNYKDDDIINEFTLEVTDDYLHYPLNLHHFYWKPDGKLLTVASNNRTGTENLLEYDLNGKLIEIKDIEFNVNHISFIDDKTLKLCSGTKIFLNDNEIKNDFQTSVIMVDFATVDQKLYIFCIDILNQFFINGILIANSVTSFTVDNKYLLLTTLDRIYCVRLIKSDLDKISVYDSLKNCYSRSLENGGTLITTIPQNHMVILQMPRGNLEIISCRIIVIDKLEDLLRLNKWHESFELIRLEKLNSNLLVDLNGERFLDNVDEFLSQVNSPNLIINFLLELVDENVFLTTYKNCVYNDVKVIENKKKKICEKIISYVHNEDITFYIRVIMIACINVDGIKYAMCYLKELYNFHDLSDCKKIILDGLQCLKLYFIDDEVTREALLTYDIEFAEYVFENSTTDPKYYKQLLGEFKSSKSDNEKRFKINNHVGNYAIAMQYLARNTENFEKLENLDYLCQYAQQHNLWKDLYIFSMRSKIFLNDVSKAYGKHLSKQNLHEEAGVVFNHVGLFEEALEEYKICSKWQDAITLIEKLNITGIKKLNHITEIAENIVKINNYKDASFLYEVYLKDCELAVDALLRGRYFSDAVRVAYGFKRLDLLETDILPNTFHYANCIREKLTSSQSLFTQYRDRLNVIRNSKVQKCFSNCVMSNEGIESTNGAMYAESIVSGMSTAITSRTRSSALSSRSKRKEDLRKHDLRVGGYYEDIALMRALHQLIEEIFTLGSDVRQLCFLLIEFKTDGLEIATELQNLLSNLQKDMKENVSIIWPPELNSLQANQTPELLAMRQNLEFLEMQYRFPPLFPKVSWQANIFNIL